MKMNTDFADKYDMLPPGCRVLCAVSGGKDSMCLLHFLFFRSKERGFEVFCAHFNHLLRGSESDADERFVRDYCAENKIGFYCGSGDVKTYAAENGLSVEEAARELRYDFLEKTAVEINADRIAAAHNADDNAETVLINLTRGTGLRGLCGIPPVRGKIIRPLLWATGARIEEYLSENGVPHIEDKTNRSEIYIRNKIRSRVVPVLKEINPAFAENVFRSSELLREDEGFISSEAEDFINKNLKENSLPAAELKSLPRAVSARVLRQAVKAQPAAERIEALYALCGGDGPSSTAEINGVCVRREYSRLVFGAPPQTVLSASELKPGDTLILPEAGFEILCRKTDDCPEFNNSLNIFFFQSESVCGKISVRCRRGGDEIRILGRNCTKSLKKLFSDAKIPRAKRESIPVIADEVKVLAVYGFGQDEKSAAKPGTGAIKVEVRTI
ncbi:MAG: tRNA lysidine(34) synthetase TilS [Oscillospiraceae bacterium]|nr:tRNA lysidine(34) synthetase TilS [Oscillospiraceae bacterium]